MREFERVQKIRQLKLIHLHYEGLLYPADRVLDAIEASNARLVMDFFNEQIAWFEDGCQEILTRVEQLKITCLHFEAILFPNNLELNATDLTTARLIIQSIDDEVAWLEARN